MHDRKIIANFGQRLAARRGGMATPDARGMAVPDFVFEKIGSVDPSDPKVLNVCPTCGTQPPFPVAQGYIRSECPCERMARYRVQDMHTFQQDQARERAKREAQEAEEASSDACYTWLGEDYSEYGLDDISFDDFSVRIMEIDPSAGRRVIVDQANEKFRQHAKERAIAFAENPTGCLILTGPYGVGKTLLACAILNYWRSLLRPGLFTTGANLFNALMAQSDTVERQRIVARMYNTPLLVIDDPDHATATEFRQNTYKEIFNKRGNRNLPTIITTNTPIKRDAMELQEIIGGAAASRLNKGLVLVGMRGEDYRRRQIGR